MPNEIFVFGSNLAGKHGKGAALFAKQKHGAIYGVPIGLQGRSYAIPTKDSLLRTLPLNSIKTYIEQFIHFAKEHKQLEFNITKIGCGLAGYCWEKDILPLFPKTLPENCKYI